MFMNTWVQSVAATAHCSFPPILQLPQHNNVVAVRRSSLFDHSYGLAFLEKQRCYHRMKRARPAAAASATVRDPPFVVQSPRRSSRRRHLVENSSHRSSLLPVDQEPSENSNTVEADSIVPQQQPSTATKANFIMSPFRATKATEAQCLTDGVAIRSGWFFAKEEGKEKESSSTLETTTILPWVGFGTYRLGQKQAYPATLEALECGYRCIDTAFIYGGETTELEVGRALQTALENNIIQDRSQVFVITKQWRKYHGYDATLKCLDLSLERLQLDYIDLYLIHWPGPAWTTMFRSKEELETHGLWHYSNVTPDEMVQLRAETWRAMEDAVRDGKIKAIGVSNFTVRQLETLRQTARLWPPAVNQVECHPLYPQNELRAYCANQGIVIQAYAALGGQDATKAQWKLLLDETTRGDGKTTTKKIPRNLLSATPIVSIAQDLGVTPAQVLLRYALERNCAITPKTATRARMIENANVFSFTLTAEHMAKLDQLSTNSAALQQDPQQGRLCWRNEPLRFLDFD